jgi:flagellar basal-body rod protein FlgB
VGPIHLFELASLQARWLAVRQATVAQNVANASTPGYSALDVTPFADVYDRFQTGLAATNAAHFREDGVETGSLTAKDTGAWEVAHSGNSVSLEQEMLKANEVNRAYSMNTAITKAFGQMLNSSVKG